MLTGREHRKCRLGYCVSRSAGRHVPALLYRIDRIGARMTGSLPWSSNAPQPQSNDPNELLRRIDRNTASLLTWMKILVIAVIALLLVTALYL